MPENNVVILAEDRSQKEKSFSLFLKNKGLNIVQTDTLRETLPLIAQKTHAVVVVHLEIGQKEIAEFVHALIDAGLHLATKVIVISSIANRSPDLNGHRPRDD